MKCRHQLVCAPQQNPLRSGPWTASPSLFVFPSLFLPLSPLFPLDASHSPVTPLFPLHTQKQGNGALQKLSATSDLRSGSKRKAAPYPSFCCSPLATPHSPLTPLIPAPLATAALRVVSAPIFTTTLSIHVGAPTILLRERTTATMQFPDRRALLFSHCALLTVAREPLFSPKSNYSRTYEPLSRKSNYSRTYAKHGGGGGC